MAHVTCRCGYSMWNGRTPNDIKFTVFSDRRFCELVENPPALFSDPTEFVLDFNDLMDMADYEVWRCQECGRLYIFDNQNDSNKAKEGLIKSTRPDWRANFHAPRGKKSQEYFVYFKIF